MHYLCDETNGWQPDLADLESKITDRTKALVVINPNNPTGAVYGREVLTQIVDLARKHQLLLLADEIYDKILYDDAKHVSLAIGRARPVVPDLQRPVQGLPGRRIPRRLAGDHRAQGSRRAASSRASACWRICGCARMCPRSTPSRLRWAATRASTTWCCRAGGCSNSATSPGKLNEIPGVSCVKPAGALYAFPRLDPEVHEIEDDEQLVLDLLLPEKILVAQGTGFNWPAPDHLRIVTLPWARDLAHAIERFGNFLSGYRQ